MKNFSFTYSRKWNKRFVIKVPICKENPYEDILYEWIDELLGLVLFYVKKTSV